MKDKLLGILHDTCVAAVSGCMIGLVQLILFGVLGRLIKGDVISGLEAGRSAVLITGSLCLIYSAGLLLKGGNLPAETFRLWPWKPESNADKARESEAGRDRGSEGCKDGQPEKAHPREDMPKFLRLKGSTARVYTVIVTSAGILAVSIIPDMLLMNMR